MSVDRVALSRGDLPRVVEHLRDWEASNGYPAGLHVGDVGWHARLPADQFDGTLAYVQDGTWVAFALVEPGLVRPRFAPAAISYDPEVAAVLAEGVDAVDGAEVLCDADPRHAVSGCARGARLGGGHGLVDLPLPLPVGQGRV